MNAVATGPTRIESVIDGKSMTGFQFWTIFLCALVALVDGFDTQAIAFVAPVISNAWSVDLSTFGRVFGAGLLGLTIGALAFGRVADRIGRKPVIVMSVLIFGLGALTTVFATSINQLILYRLLTGIGLGGAMPNIIALTAEYAPKRIRAFVVTAMFCGFPVGAVIGGLISTWAIPAFGWTSIFIAGGILPLLLVPLLITALPESIRFLASCPGREAEAVKLLSYIDPASRPDPWELTPIPGPHANARIGLVRLFQDGSALGTLLLWLAFFCNLLVMYFLINWLPAVLQRAGVPIERAIIATVLLNAGGVIGGLTVSNLIDRFGPRRVLAAAYLGAAIFVAAIGLEWPWVAATLAVIFVAGFCIIGAQFGLNAFAAEYYPTSLRATGVGAALGIGRIGSILGPVVGGLLLGMMLDTSQLFLIAAVPALVGCFAILGAARPRFSHAVPGVTPLTVPGAGAALSVSVEPRPISATGERLIIGDAVPAAASAPADAPALNATTESVRAQLSRDSKALNIVQFWEQRGDIELLRPRAKVVPFRWRWSDIEPRLRVASRTVPIEECERRALVFANPGLDGKPYITHTLFAAYSLYNPGEVAPVHRHTPSASRFVLEGDGGFTTVQGEKMPMSRGDLILTPTGTWHDHGNDGKEPIIWVDVLNVPLVESLNATMFEFDYEETDPASHNGAPIKRAAQTIRHPIGHSENLYAAGGLKPTFVNHRRGTTEHSPMFMYKWERAREQLQRLKDYEGSPYDGIMLEYVDPVTGRPVMPSMSFRCQMLRKSETTKLHRRMASTLYVCLEGSGVTQVGDTRLEWNRNDVFAVPNWAWHNHVNTGSTDAVLYSVTDEPAMRRLGLYRHQAYDAEGTPVDLPVEPVKLSEEARASA